MRVEETFLVTETYNINEVMHNGSIRDYKLDSKINLLVARASTALKLDERKIHDVEVVDIVYTDDEVEITIVISLKHRSLDNYRTFYVPSGGSTWK